MKKLNTSQITKLRRAAEQLVEQDTFSCNAVRYQGGYALREMYADAVGVGCRPGFLEVPPSHTIFQEQLTRSLAVLMFIEANR